LLSVSENCPKECLRWCTTQILQVRNKQLLHFALKEPFLAAPSTDSPWETWPRQWSHYGVGEGTWDRTATLSRDVPELARSTFSDTDSAPFQKFLNPGLEIFQIWESHSSSESNCHRPIRDLSMFSFNKCPSRLKVLPKPKSDSGYGSGFQGYRDSSHNLWWLGLDSSHDKKNGDSARFESRFSQNDSSRVTFNDSRLESESFSQNLWVPHGQTQFVCTQRNEHFLLQWWSKLAYIFCFACLVVLCCILRIKFPQLA